MVNIERDVLSEKYATTILKYVLEKGTVKKYDILEVIKSSWTLDRILTKLEKAGYIEIKEQILGRRVYTITLTEQGRAVAEQLKNLEKPITPSKRLDPKDQEALIYLSTIDKLDAKDFTEIYAYSTMSKLAELKLIEQVLDNKAYPPKNMISLTEKGKKVAKYLKKIEETLK